MPGLRRRKNVAAAPRRRTGTPYMVTVSRSLERALAHVHTGLLSHAVHAECAVTYRMFTFTRLRDHSPLPSPSLLFIYHCALRSRFVDVMIMWAARKMSDVISNDCAWRVTFLQSKCTHVWRVIQLRDI